jgi:hypothetical protein
MLQSITMNVPVTLPSPERIEELIREGAREAAAAHFVWLTITEAATHMNCPKRTFERKKKSLKIPISIIDGVKRIARQDLDAIMIAHTVADKSGNLLIQFPTQIAKAAAQHAA